MTVASWPQFIIKRCMMKMKLNLMGGMGKFKTAIMEEIDKHTGTDKAVDVPYTGSVLGVHARDGISVVFDHTVGADGRPERIHISNEDEWMWGARRTKAASWNLQVTYPAGREPPRYLAYLL